MDGWIDRDSVNSFFGWDTSPGLGVSADRAPGRPCFFFSGQPRAAVGRSGLDSPNGHENSGKLGKIMMKAWNFMGYPIFRAIGGELDGSGIEDWIWFDTNGKICEKHSIQHTVCTQLVYMLMSKNNTIVTQMWQQDCWWNSISKKHCNYGFNGNVFKARKMPRTKNRDLKMMRHCVAKLCQLCFTHILCLNLSRTVLPEVVDHWHSQQLNYCTSFGVDNLYTLCVSHTISISISISICIYSLWFGPMWISGPFLCWHHAKCSADEQPTFIFFRGVESTNQIYNTYKYMYIYIYSIDK